MRNFEGVCLAILLVVGVQSLAGAEPLSNKEGGAGLKEALARGAGMAVDSLGKEGGFLGNPQVKIGLPESLQKGEKLARKLGMSKSLDELTEAMNHAAEQAVVEARPILINAVGKMSISDAGSIISGGDDAATQYFKRTTAAPIGEKFLPIVQKATAKVQLADKYNQYASKAAQLGLLDQKDANLDAYVTRKALDGLFVMIAEQEKAIRRDPIGTGSALLQKVFKSLGN